MGMRRTVLRLIAAFMVASATALGSLLAVARWPRSLPSEAEQDEIYSIALQEAEQHHPWKERGRALLDHAMDAPGEEFLDDPGLWPLWCQSTGWLDKTRERLVSVLAAKSARGYSHKFGQQVQLANFVTVAEAPETLFVRLSRIAFDPLHTQAYVEIVTTDLSFRFSTEWCVGFERAADGHWRVTTSTRGSIT